MDGEERPTEPARGPGTLGRAMSLLLYHLHLHLPLVPVLLLSTSFSSSTAQTRSAATGAIGRRRPAARKGRALMATRVSAWLAAPQVPLSALIPPTS